MQLITKSQLLEMVPWSHTHILREEKAGRFPKRIKPGEGGRNAKSFWVREEIEDWIQQHIDRRDNSPDNS
jgi:prophage regulatory protein